MKTVYLYLMGSALALTIFYGGVRFGEHHQSAKTKLAEMSSQHSWELAQKWEKRANECAGEAAKRILSDYKGR